METHMKSKQSVSREHDDSVDTVKFLKFYRSLVNFTGDGEEGALTRLELLRRLFPQDCSTPSDD